MDVFVNILFSPHIMIYEHIILYEGSTKIQLNVVEYKLIPIINHGKSQMLVKMEPITEY